MEYVIRREGNEDYLEHYGVRGQKPGVRRYQNPDGSLTPEGREHYGVGDRYRNADGSLTKKGIKEAARIEKYRNDNSFTTRRLKEGLRSKGVSESEIYGMYKTSRATKIGTILAGPVAGIAAGVISSHRYKKSGEAFAKSILNG